MISVKWMRGGKWFDVFVALIQYLLSGESKVGLLNNSHSRN
jgi:hypothetical protein